MCLLYLIFIVPFLALGFAPVLALILALNAALTALQKKRNQDDPLGAEELNRRSANQIATIAFLMLFLLLGYLAVRYKVT